MPTDEMIVAQTREWVLSVVIGDNFCPFARKEMENDTIRYCVIRDTGHEGTGAWDENAFEYAMMALLAECRLLDEDAGVETTLLIIPEGVDDFDHYLGLLSLANELLAAQGYEGRYQLASFHPDYCFAGASKDDPANYTNRSPYPTLHLIREASIERVLQGVEKPERIPERNIRYAREAGLAAMQARLQACLKPKE
ncbi:MAG: DUF1415 domain-containing protein [Hahellaceae bacterium]|nr:DUF1415 domain-containing protein [Hahellaceae bacterium]MCP5168288.1 DUF1415 domain-containing protein [Hahellaceae bacterium]